MRVLLAACGLSCLLMWCACSPRATSPSEDAGPDGDAADTPDGDADVGDSDADGDYCSCLAGSHNDFIYVVGDEAELYSYDPVTNEFDEITLVRCFGSQRPYSMSVDAQGRAWILYADVEDIFTIDVNSPGSCDDPEYIPRAEGFGLFGMAFASNSATDPCAQLYIHSYSGTGPFTEGPDVGALGVIDTETMTTRHLAAIDYDGGELAGTGDGRLFAFAGVGSAKLIEYDKVTGEALETTVLEGFSRTNASAFAFHSGDFYFFTEAPPTACDECLRDTCLEAYEECLALPLCVEELNCAIEAGGVSDDCGGGITDGMHDCLPLCTDACLHSARARVSQVTRLDYDNSDGEGRVLTVVHPSAPIRVVGAGSSTCVQTIPY